MPEFKLGDEVLIRGTIVGRNMLGHPVVAFPKEGVSGAYTDHRLVIPNPTPAPPREYEFQFSVTVTRPVVVKATSEGAARVRVAEVLAEDIGVEPPDESIRIILEDVTLGGSYVAEWPR